MKKKIFVCLLLMIGLIGFLACKPVSGDNYEFIELTERWTNGNPAGGVECLTYDGDDIYLGGFELNEDYKNVPTFWRNIKDNKITLPLPTGVDGAKIRNIKVVEGTVYAMISSTEGWYYFDGTDYYDSFTDGSDVYNELHNMEVINGDIYVAATIEDIDNNDLKLAVFKNGTKDGDITLDPDLVSVYRVRSIFEQNGNICLASGYKSDDGTDVLTYAGYWVNDGSGFVAKGDVDGAVYTDKIQVIESMINDNTYMLNGIEGFTMFVDGEELTLEFPPDPGVPGEDAIPVGFSNMIATPDGAEVYTFGTVGTLIEVGSYRWHAVVWDKNGNLETYVDYQNLVSEYDDMYEDSYDDIQAVAGVEDYAFPLNDLEKTDKYSVCGYLRRLPE